MKKKLVVLYQFCNWQRKTLFIKTLFIKKQHLLSTSKKLPLQWLRKCEKLTIMTK